MDEIINLTLNALINLIVGMALAGLPLSLFFLVDCDLKGNAIYFFSSNWEYFSSILCFLDALFEFYLDFSVRSYRLLVFPHNHCYL